MARTSRRSFLRVAAASAAAVGAAPIVLARDPDTLPAWVRRPVAPNDRVRIATIGMGIIGFIDTNAALRVPGVELVAAADLYQPRLHRAQEVYGSDLAVTRDYREILARPDIDAVIVATPDHWHEQVAVEALRAGKHVYLEKPMVHRIEEGPRVIAAQQETGRTLEVGSQHASSIVYERLGKLIADGAIGELNMVEAKYNRNSSIGAWQYSVPPNVSPEELDWDTFLGRAPERPFDPVRFFRWRNYWDYGTAMAGDLYVHLLTGIHTALGAVGPTSVMASGGLRYWNDGREVPDVMLALLEYPETAAHPSFTLSLQTNFADGSGGGSSFRFVGNEGVIEVSGGGLKLTRNPVGRPTRDEIMSGYNSTMTFDEATRAAVAAQYDIDHAEPEAPRMSESSEYRAPRGYDSRLDHFVTFFDGARTGAPVLEDAVFGYRAAAPTLLANQSYREGRPLQWDPEAMRVVD